MIYNRPIRKKSYDNIYNYVSKTDLKSITKVVPFGTGCVVFGSGSKMAYTPDFSSWWGIDLGQDTTYQDIYITSEPDAIRSVIISNSAYFSAPTRTRTQFVEGYNWISSTNIGNNNYFLIANDVDNVYALQKNGYYWKFNNENFYTEESGEPALSFTADKIKRLSNGKVVAIADFGYLGYTDNIGSSWTEPTLGDWYYSPDIDVSDGGTYVVVYSDSTMSYDLNISSNLSSWTRIDFEDGFSGPSFVVYDKYRQMFIMNGNSWSNKIFLGTFDGLSWTQYDTPFSVSFCAIYEKNIVVFSSAGDIAFSNDGKTWKTKPYT